MKVKENKKNLWYIKIFLIIEIIAITFMGIFYFSCGKALYERSSDGNIDEFMPTNDVGEILQGNRVEQTYTSEMDKITAVGVMVSNYGQSFSSHINIKCEDITDGHEIAENSYDVNKIGVNQYIYISIPQNANIIRGHVVKITVTSDAETGNAPTVLYNIGYEFEKSSVGKDAALLLNGSVIPGTMCIAIQGDNYVWTGPNYWKLVSVAILMIAVVYWILACRALKGKQSYFFGSFWIVKNMVF